MAYTMNVSAKQEEYILRLPLSDEAKNVISPTSPMNTETTPLGGPGPIPPISKCA